MTHVYFSLQGLQRKKKRNKNTNYSRDQRKTRNPWFPVPCIYSFCRRCSSFSADLVDLFAKYNNGRVAVPHKKYSRICTYVASYEFRDKWKGERERLNESGKPMKNAFDVSSMKLISGFGTRLNGCCCCPLFFTWLDWRQGKTRLNTICPNVEA